MKIFIPFLFCILLAQESYEGEFTFDYTGTENGSFTSIIQDSIITGFAYNQMGLDTSYLVMMAITEQDENEFDLFLAILQDTTFPVQPRTWEIPGQGDAENPLSFETIVVHIPGMDSSFVAEIADLFTDTTNTWDSLDLTIILADLYTELADDLYLGFSGELEISNVSDSSFSGTFNSIMLKPTFHIPPHMVSVNNGEFSFNKVALPELSANPYPIIPNTFTIYHPIEIHLIRKQQSSLLSIEVMMKYLLLYSIFQDAGWKLWLMELWNQESIRYDGMREIIQVEFILLCFNPGI